MGHRYVDKLSTRNCGVALGWSDGRAPHPLEGTCLFLAGDFSYGNYYHWLTGALRELVMLQDARASRAVDRVIVCAPDPVPAFLADSLNVCRVDHPRLSIWSNPFDVSVDAAVRTGPAEIARALPVDEYARKLRARLRLDRDPGARRHRIVISRRDAAVRRVTNEDELVASLARYGFEVVVPGHLDFLEQVRAFADAEMVVAPHGAALANLLFCRQETAVLEFRNPAMERPWFERLAARIGLPYEALACAQDPRSLDDFVVDVESAARAVERLLVR